MPVIVRLTAVALALAIVSTAAGGAASFTDSRGDSGGAADIARVRIRNTATNDVVVAVQFANRPEWAGGTVFVYLDTDRNASTGHDGAEYFLGLDAESEWSFGRWDGTAYQTLPGDGISAAFGEGEVEFTFNARHIGGVRAFDFAVKTEQGDDTDDAPPFPRTWSFRLTRPRVTGGTLTLAPAVPRAGANFAVAGVTLLVDGVAREPARRYSCSATLAGKPLYRLRKCVWKVPKSARGKLLTVDVRVTRPNGRGSQLFLFDRFRVR